MDIVSLWKVILIVFAGTFLLRVAGRKTIAQTTIAETVIMISVGTLLIQPVVSKSLPVTFATGAVFVLTLVAMEYGQFKIDSLEKLITGRSKVIIENGVLQEKNLAKLRLTVDQLEMYLRQKSVASIDDVEWATLEPNGQIGFTLKEDAQPVTKRDLKQLYEQLQLVQSQLAQNNMFEEVAAGGHKHEPPEHLK